jgi:hypothetical protein
MKHQKKTGHAPAYWLATVCLLVMSCGAGCANITKDTEAKTAIEIAACVMQAEVNALARVEQLCADMSPAECPSTDEIRTRFAAELAACAPADE